MSYIITYKCLKCGLQYKFLIKSNKLYVSINDKLHNIEQIINRKNNNYLKCIECHYINPLKFEIIYKPNIII